MSTLPRDWNRLSVAALWDALNDPSRFATPQSTIEAILYSVRERGTAALDEPANVERLGRCDAKAKEIIKKRIETLRAKGILR